MYGLEGNPPGLRDLTHGYITFSIPSQFRLNGFHVPFKASFLWGVLEDRHNESPPVSPLITLYILPNCDHDCSEGTAKAG